MERYYLDLTSKFNRKFLMGNGWHYFHSGKFFCNAYTQKEQSETFDHGPMEAESKKEVYRLLVGVVQNLILLLPTYHWNSL